VLNPVQPAAIEPARLKHEYGRELCSWGSMGEQQTLPFSGRQRTSAVTLVSAVRRSPAPAPVAAAAG